MSKYNTKTHIITGSKTSVNLFTICILLFVVIIMFVANALSFRHILRGDVFISIAEFNSASNNISRLIIFFPISIRAVYIESTPRQWWNIFRSNQTSFLQLAWDWEHYILLNTADLCCENGKLCHYIYIWQYLALHYIIELWRYIVRLTILTISSPSFESWSTASFHFSEIILNILPNKNPHLKWATCSALIRFICGMWNILFPKMRKRQHIIDAKELTHKGHTPIYLYLYNT